MVLPDNMRQRKVIDVSLMDIAYNSNTPRQTPSRANSSRCRRRTSSAKQHPSNKYRHSSPSGYSTVSTTITLDPDFKTSSASVKSDNGCYSKLATSNPMSLSINGTGKSLESCSASRVSSRVTSGVSRMTLSSCGRSFRSRRSVMSSTARSSVFGSSSSTTFPDHIGTQPGLTIWTLEGGHLAQLADSDQGFLHQGNAYLILKIKADGSSYLHIWHGSQSAEPSSLVPFENSVEANSAFSPKYYIGTFKGQGQMQVGKNYGSGQNRQAGDQPTVLKDRDAMQWHGNNLDTTIDGASVFTIESQGHETQILLQHFESTGLIVVEGKSRSYLGRACKYTQRLYRVEGRHIPTATCMDCSRSALAADRALILDGFPRMYVWLGPLTDYNTRVKAIQVATALRTWQRKGIAHIIVIEKTDTSLHEAFVQKLKQDEMPTEEDCMARNGTETRQDYLHLYRINGERVMYDMPFVAKKPLQHKYLTSKDSFLLDQGPQHPVYIWLGSASASNTLYAAIQRAQNFAYHHNYPTTTAICRLSEGSEPLSFKASFNNWTDRLVKERQLVRSYNVANIGRALFSRSDCRTISQMSEFWSDDDLLKHSNGTTQMFRIDDDHLTHLKCEQKGVFHNWQCYIILHKELTDYGETNILYYWLGSKCSQEEKDTALRVAFSMSTELHHQTFIMRILDGKETKTFMHVLQNSMVVYDADIRRHCENRSGDSHDRSMSPVSEDFSQSNDDVIKMFGIREFLPGCMRVSQVFPRTSSLNSSAAFVVFNSSVALVWYGKNSTASDREYAKNMLSYFCPDRSRQFDIINEKKEQSKFYNSVIHDGQYPTEFITHIIHRRPPRLALYLEHLQSFTFYEEFSQEDLNEADTFILDTFDQLQIWCSASTLDKNHKSLSNIVQTYLDKDLTGRGDDEIQICFVVQGSEPDIFTKYFPCWDDYGYGGQIAFQAARKRTRQENASIDIEAQMVDLTYTTTSKASFKDLVKGVYLSDDIDRQNKEYHLTDKEFTRCLGMTRAQFYRLPLWKQQQILKSARLVEPPKPMMDAYSDCKDQQQSQISLDLIKFVKNCNTIT